jgi:7-keto-8-aminopelargonate synthetase-like enzyme
MYGRFKDHLTAELQQIRDRGLFKKERVLTTPQGVEIRTESGAQVVNFCTNNYLGLCNEPRVMAAANYAFFRWGFGLASVRFICGTQHVHKELERRMADFLGMNDALLYSSAFDANGGVFEPLLDDRSAIISDELNHASIIDGVRLAKAKRFVYRNNDMADLEDQPIEAREAKFKLIVTDGVFSMDGIIAQVDRISELAKKYEALVLVDDSHATGFIGPTGRGTHEHCGVMDKVDIIVTTFGKALGGASGGCVAGRQEIIDFLRQGRARTSSRTPCPRPSPGRRSRSSRSSGNRPSSANGSWPTPASSARAWRNPASVSSPASIRSSRSSSAISRTTPGSAGNGNFVVISNENNGSDGEAFVEHFKARKLGTVVGVPSWGGLVGILNQQLTIDNGTVEQSNNAFYGREGKWLVENHGADPDVLVDNDPGSVMAGRDLQLEKAIEVMLEKIKTNPSKFAPKPAYPKK